MPPKVSIKEKIASIKSHPNYIGYDLSGLDNITNVTDRPDMKCSRGHPYKNNISKMYGKWPRCRFCGGSNDEFTQENEDQIAAYRDCEGGQYAYKSQDGRMIILTINGGFRPLKGDPIIVVCPVHGDQKSTISDLIRPDGSGRVCTPCNEIRYSRNRTKTTEEFIEQAQNRHNVNGVPIYDYSKSLYTGAHEYITVTCKKHGDFSLDAASHTITGAGCNACGHERSAEKLRHTRGGFVNQAKETHKNTDGTPKYDYSKSYIDPINGKDCYKNIDEKVCIICPFHGEFFQIAYDHMNGRGCFLCNASPEEQLIYKLLSDSKIEFEYQKEFEDMLSTRGNELKLDFYIKSKHMAIEYNGRQHYLPVNHWGGLAGYLEQHENDVEKEKYCKEKNMDFRVIKYDSDVEAEIKFIIEELKK